MTAARVSVWLDSIAIARDAVPEVADRVEAELSGLAAELGVAAPHVVVEREGEPPGARRFASLWVGDEPCRFPLEFIALAAAYVEGVPRVRADDDELLAMLRASDAATLGETLGHTFRIALSARRELLGAEADGLRSGIVDVLVEPSYLAHLTTQHQPDAGLFPFLREGLFNELGLPLPPFHLAPDESLRPGAFAFRIAGLRTMPRMGLDGDTLLVNASPELLREVTEAAVATLNPATWWLSALAPAADRRRLEERGFTVWDSWGFIVLCLARALRLRAHRLMTGDVVERLCDTIGEVYPTLARDAKRHVSTTELAGVLRALVSDGVSIRNLRRILEALLRYELAGPQPPVIDPLGYVRTALGGLIGHNVARGQGTAAVYLLDPDLERALGEPLPSVEVRERIAGAVLEELSLLPKTVSAPAILTQPALREGVRAALRHEFPNVAVIAYGELPPDVNVQPIARIGS